MPTCGGRSDEDVITSLIEVTDSRFQDGLLNEAKRAGKVRKNYQIPDRARHNRPERLERDLARYRSRELFPAFPFGTDLTAEEVVLRKALRKVKRTLSWNKLQLPNLTDIGKTIAIPIHAQPYLKRMELDHPRSFKERILQRAVVYALASVDAI